VYDSSANHRSLSAAAHWCPPGQITQSAAEAARLKLQLSNEEWNAWEQRKDHLMAERQRIREQLKQRFEEFCERNGVGPWNGTSYGKGAKTALRWAAAF
jgi:hypothetical protein